MLHTAEIATMQWPAALVFLSACALGVATPEALRTAKLTLRARAGYAHPFYWGAYAVIGG